MPIKDEHMNGGTAQRALSEKKKNQQQHDKWQLGTRYQRLKYTKKVAGRVSRKLFYL